MSLALDLCNAIQKLRPGASFTINDDKLEWTDTSLDPPTDSEIANALEDYILQKPYTALRIERNRLLALYDWVILKSYSIAQPVPLDWANYLQSLRDLPSIAYPKLDENGFLDMSSVQWPNPPPQ